MTTANNTLRALALYALALPLALFLGYLVATPDLLSYEIVGLVLLALATPLILKWHYAILLASWNATAVVFIFPGRPQIWMLMGVVSLALALVRRTLLRDMRFVYAPSVALPMVCLGLVVFLTARLTSGFGLRAFGSQTVGGKAYFWIFCGIAGFFAMLAYRVPRRRAFLLVSLFFLGSLINFVGSLLPFVSPGFRFIFWLFPVDSLGGLGSVGETEEGITRFFGLTLAALGAFLFLLMKDGISEPLRTGKLRHFLWLGLALFVTASGGYRSFFLLMVMTFLLVFYFEGLFRSKYGAVLIGTVLFGLVLLIPLAQRLPLSVQRTLSVLPYQIDPMVRNEAQDSNRWRVDMWKVLLPEIPKYFWFGKGVGVSGVDLEMTAELVRTGRLSSQEQALLTGNFHNGPLTVLIQFGIWGFLCWIWLLAAAIRAMHFNYLYGDPALKKINTLLLSYLVARTIYFFTVFGDFNYDFATFAGVIGLGLALNHGIRRPPRPSRYAKPIPLWVAQQKAMAVEAKGNVSPVG